MTIISLDSARLIDLIEGYALGYSAIGQHPPFAIRDEIARRLLALHDHAGAVTTNRQTRETLEVALNGRPEAAT